MATLTKCRHLRNGSVFFVFFVKGGLWSMFLAVWSWFFLKKYGIFYDHLNIIRDFLRKLLHIVAEFV